MTCRERLKLENPDDIDPEYGGGCYGCPSDHGYLERPKECIGFEGYDCTECWDREIPETKEAENKEEEKMAVKSNIRKTKQELLDEINELKKDLEKVERYKAYDLAAADMMAMKDSFTNAGFTEEQAFQMTIEMIKVAGGMKR